MTKRVYIRIDDDDQLAEIGRIAAELGRSGLEVTSVSPVIGQIAGTAADGAVATLKTQALAVGAHLVVEEDDLVHHLPPPGSGVQ